MRRRTAPAGRRQGGAPPPVPRGLGVLAVVAVVALAAPLVALVLETPWGSFGTLLTHERVLPALRLSFLSSGAAALLTVVLGVPLAWVLARREFPGRDLLRTLAVLPMVLPPVVGGVALLLTFGRRGLLGGPLAAITGVSLPFSTAGVVLAQTFVAMPFLVVAVEAGLLSLDARYEEVAATLGAGRWTTLRRVTLPMVAPSLAAGVALSWARALGEFGATLTFAGNLPGVTQTMPLAVYQELPANPAVASALSVILLGVSVLVLVALRGRFLAAR